MARLVPVPSGRNERSGNIRQRSRSTGILGRPDGRRRLRCLIGFDNKSVLCYTNQIINLIKKRVMAKELNQKKAQIAAELYATYRFQEEAEKLNVATTTGRSNILKSDFLRYLNNIPASFETFKESGPYYNNLEKHAKSIIEGWSREYPGQTFDLYDMTVAGRAARKKGDIELLLSGGSKKEISLKNYSKDFANIQVCSGTFTTFLLNLLFDSHSISKCEYNSTVFSTKKADQCIWFITEWAKDKNISETKLVNAFVSAKQINDDVKIKYTVGPYAEWFTDDVENQWKTDCESHGNNQIALTIDAMSSFPASVIKQRFLKMTGMDSDGGELLCLFPDQVVDSITNLKFKKLVERLQNDNMQVKFSASGKSICMTAEDEGIILKVMVPFTLNKNGAWHDGAPEYKSKDKMIVQHNQRRPKKCKELNTSINTYVYLKEAIK